VKLNEQPRSKLAETNEWDHCARVNFRLNPKFVLEVGNVLATNGLFRV